MHFAYVYYFTQYFLTVVDSLHLNHLGALRNDSQGICLIFLIRLSKGVLWKSLFLISYPSDSDAARFVNYCAVYLIHSLVCSYYNLPHQYYMLRGRQSRACIME